MVRSATQFPKKCKKFFLQICKSFFFFSKLRFSLSSTMVYKSLILFLYPLLLSLICFLYLTRFFLEDVCVDNRLKNPFHLFHECRHNCHNPFQGHLRPANPLPCRNLLLTMWTPEVTLDIPRRRIRVHPIFRSQNSWTIFALYSDPNFARILKKTGEYSVTQN